MDDRWVEQVGAGGGPVGGEGRSSRDRVGRNEVL